MVEIRRASPSSFLEQVRVRKRDEVAARRAQVSAAALADRAAPTPRSLRQALQRPRARAILELKRRSPSAGVLAEAVDIGDVLRAYQGVADAVSVLADDAFDGTLDDVAEVRERTSLPILCKDFVLGPDQVVEARAFGADAALVILALLDDDTARACLAQAEALGMDVLVEAHDAAEVDRAVALGADLIGINNRDLGTLAIDLATTEALAGRVPSDRTLISESGINDDADLRRLAPLVDGFLIGSAVMRAADRFDAARALLPGRIKVCGLGHPDDARLARQAGARFGGLIFAAGSPRQVTAEQAGAIVKGAPELPFVGVFRDPDPDTVAALSAQLGLVAVQLHDADPAAIKAVRQALPAPVEVWSALGVDTQGHHLGTAAAREADRTVVDSARRAAGGQVLTGGTGMRVAPEAIDGLDLSHHLLAGGLSPENIADARQSGAYCLDISSSIEIKNEALPRRKDPVRLQQLFDHARPPCRSDRAPEGPHAC